ncbi:MAG: DUF732 domain-containing protein [Microcoleaceae cyanobacterium MO_207.B10]|nr:DUF732 domain-containing protein [Microcoleaceae cyanobacterium MO_207.B10]
MQKNLIISITIILNILFSASAKAENFEILLESSLSEAEAKIHNILGSEKAVEVGRNACSAFDAGISVEEFSLQAALSLLQQGLTQEQLQTAALYTGKVIAAGVNSLCPEYKSKLEELQQPGNN